jgi:phenylpyruvate tautomerase PptA (4-oxalocrotonate tautomerase family)
VALDNPFIIGRLPEGAAFADREAEVARLAEAFSEPGGKLIVYGDRRLGKSAAIQVAADRVRSAKLPVAIINLSTASSASEAANQILTAVHQAVGRSWMDLFKAVAKSLSIEVSAKTTPESGGMPIVTVSLEGARAAKPDTAAVITAVLDAVESELRRRKRRIGIALDEFQRIYEWGGEDAEWALKGTTERHRAISYVMAGSARSLIEEMVSDRARALWKLFDVMHMGPIDPVVLTAWIEARCTATGVRAVAGAAKAIVTLAGPRTRDIVQLARLAWIGARAQSGHRLTTAVAEAAFEGLVREQDAVHRRVWGGCDARQQDLLRILAANPATAVMGTETAIRFRLGSKSTVQHSVEGLVRSELLTVAEGVRGGGRYSFDDPFFRRWVQVTTLGDMGLTVPPLGK